MLFGPAKSIVFYRYVDRGLSSSKMALKVTDGSSISTTAVLRIETFSLRIAPEVNTGLEVVNVMGTAALITNSNLSFTSNAADQGLVIKYHVVSSPKAGVLQLRRTNGQWSSTDHFSQLDLQGSRLRYLLQRPRQVIHYFHMLSVYEKSIKERSTRAAFFSLGKR